MKVVYFAWVRTRAGIDGESVDPPATVATVRDLVAWLREHGEAQTGAFADMASIRVAVNQEHVDFDHPVGNGDEVAFFPPVTGG